MARLVKHTRSFPFKIEVGGEAKYICGCGLSSKLPYCDGTHKITKDEDEGKVFWYDHEKNKNSLDIELPVMPDRYTE